MKILVVNQNNNVDFRQPYLCKYNSLTSKDAVYVGSNEELDFADNEGDAFEKMKESHYDSLIICTGGAVDGCELLEKIRSDGSMNQTPVTIF